MSARSADPRRGAVPSDGWSALLLVLVMCVTMALAIDDVAFVLGQGGLTDFLPWIAAAGVLVAFVGVRVGWGRWTIYAVGSAFAALIVPLIIGRLLLPDGGSPNRLFHEAASVVVEAVMDVTVRGQQFTAEYGHHLFYLGLIVFATSMFAGYATFGHRRPLNAIVIVGIVLLIPMSITFRDQLPYLVAFSVAALFLLVRYHVLEEQLEWIRRRIGDPSSISSVYLRGGTVFIVGAVGASLLLTTVARSAPLESAMSGFGTGLIEWSRGLQRFLPTGGQTRPVGSEFDPNSTSIVGKWVPDASRIMTIHVDPADETPYYWRVIAFDRFESNGWRVSGTDSVDRDADANLLDASLDAPDPRYSTPVTYTVIPDRGSTNLVPAPLMPVSIDQSSSVRTVGTGAWLSSIARRGEGPYSVTSLLRRTGDAAGEVNESALRVAGEAYPAEIRTLYLQVPDGVMPEGGAAETLFEQLRTESQATNAYDFASYLQRVFSRSGPEALFTYDADVLDLMTTTCKDLSTVECFALERRGYCQFYATTMAIFLREARIPARVVEGFLPGERDADGNESVLGSARHQWVEVYFPGYGWVPFDPTGGGVSRQQALPTGPPQPSAAPIDFGSFLPPVRQPPEGDGGPNRSPGTNGSGGGGTAGTLGAAFAIGLLLALAMGGLAFAAWHRGPRNGTTADHAYRTVTRIAGRLGFGPRSTQTVYEYAGGLGEVLPDVRPELQTVALAKVETMYGRGILDPERLADLRAAERRLRLGLLRLVFHRKERPRR